MRKVELRWTPETGQVAKATRKDNRIALGDQFRELREGDSGADKYFLDSADDRHISDSGTFHGS
jgi:hypothetical protein